jgi:Ca2+-transporting ATPase
VPNAAFRYVVGGTFVLLAVVLFFPMAQQLFHFGPLHPTDLMFSLIAGVTCVLWFEALKLYQRRVAMRPRLANGAQHHNHSKCRRRGPARYDSKL